MYFLQQSLDGEFIGAFHMGNRRLVNWEKIGVYIACTGTFFMFWQSQASMMIMHSYMNERIAKLEVKVDRLIEDGRK